MGLCTCESTDRPHRVGRQKLLEMAQLACVFNCCSRRLGRGLRHCSDTATLQQWAACTHYEILGVELGANPRRSDVRIVAGPSDMPGQESTGDADAASRCSRRRCV